MSALITGSTPGISSLSGAVLVQRGRTYGYDNRLICDLAAHGTAIRAICSVDTRDPRAGSEAHRLLALPGVAGLRLMEPAKGVPLDWLDGPGARDIWREVNDHCAVIDVHVFPWNRAVALPRLAMLARDFPALTIIIDNLGNPTVDQGPPRFGIDDHLLHLVDCEQVHFKISAMVLDRIEAAGHDPALALASSVGLLGAERLCWGSDVLGPGLGLADAIDQALDATSLVSAQDAAMVLSGNARRIFAIS